MNSLKNRFRKVFTAMLASGVIVSSALSMTPVTANAAYKDDKDTIDTYNASFTSFVFGTPTDTVLLFDTVKRPVRDSDLTKTSKTYSRGKSHTEYSLTLPEKKLPKKLKENSFTFSTSGKNSNRVNVYYKGKKIVLRVYSTVSINDKVSLTGTKTSKKANCGTISKKYPAAKTTYYSVDVSNSDYKKLSSKNLIRLSDGKIYEVTGNLSINDRYTVNVKKFSGTMDNPKTYTVKDNTVTLEKNSYTETIKKGDNVIIPLDAMNDPEKMAKVNNSTGENSQFYAGVQQIIVLLNVESVTDDGNNIMLKGKPVDISEKACTDRLIKTLDK